MASRCGKGAAVAERPFLSRWSRLKQEARSQTSERHKQGRRGGAAPVLEEPSQQAALPPEAEAGTATVPASQPAGPSGQGAQTEPEREAPADIAKLPDIESLTADSDFTVFMRKGVPKSLQRRALRKLWASDPIFAFQDGLTDYQDDYTDGATVVDGMKSSYQVGRGFLTDAELAENHSIYNASRQARIEAEAARDAAREAGDSRGGDAATPPDGSADDTASTNVAETGQEVGLAQEDAPASLAHLPEEGASPDAGAEQASDKSKSDNRS